jgi:hypothetical protein
MDRWIGWVSSAQSPRKLRTIVDFATILMEERVAPIAGPNMSKGYRGRAKPATLGGQVDSCVQLQNGDRALMRDRRIQ